MNRAWLGLALSLLLVAASARADLQLPPGAPECVQWGAQEVERALDKAGVASTEAEVAVRLDATAGMPAEAFELTAAEGKVTIAAGDAVGAMYGLLELAEQLRHGARRGDWPKVAATLKSTYQKPACEFRADNPFLHTKPFILAQEAMWRDYLDLLARCRYNVLDLHGGYDLDTTTFPNLYPLLVSVPEYPFVGKPAEQQKNLTALKNLVAHAKQRGIRVAFMNYTVKVPGLFDDSLADYTAKAVATLIREVPDLYMLGSRVGDFGEPGLKASIFGDAYLKGVADAGRRDLRLYTRSWLTTQAELQRVAEASGGQLDIEIKYNGEHLGLPYHAIHGGHHSYSYQQYIREGAPYRIIWQVRANGTHRFWAWQDTDFIRRTIRSLPFGHARGLTLEPHIAYFDVRHANLYGSPRDRAVYRWTWQKHWMWYYAWGRLAYNPDLPEATLIAEYRDRYGAAGPSIYAALQQASTIVPLVFAFNPRGPDHRHISPETETGMDDSLLSFDRPALDARSFASIREYVDARDANQPDGRVSPPRVARLLLDAATATRTALRGVTGLSGRTADEWRLLKPDLLCASHLGDYYGHRIYGVTHWAWALKTGSEADRQLALQHLAASRAAWRRLAEIGDAAYAPLLNMLRKQEDFRWTSKIAQIDRIDARLAKEWDNRYGPEDGPTLDFTPADLGQDPPIRLAGVKHQVSEGQAQVTCRPSAPMGIRGVTLWYKPLPSEKKWESLPMERRAGGYSATTRITASGMLYLLEVQTEDGQARNFPDVFKTVPYWVIYPEEAIAGGARPEWPDTWW